MGDNLLSLGLDERREAVEAMEEAAGDQVGAKA